MMPTIREDSVKHDGRYIVPTSENTIWVDSWEQFKQVGGTTCWSEDQTEITLSLPERYKFSINFNK